MLERAVIALLGLSLSRLRSRRGRPEIRVTITHDGLPARGGGPNAGGPGDLADAGGRPMHVTGGRDPLLERLLAPAAIDWPRTRAQEMKAVAAGSLVGLEVPALAIARARDGAVRNAGSLPGNGVDARGNRDSTGPVAGGRRTNPHDAPDGISRLRAAQPGRTTARMDTGQPPNGREAGGTGGGGRPDAGTPAQPRSMTASGSAAAPEPIGGLSAAGSRPAPDRPVPIGGAPALDPLPAREVPTAEGETRPAETLPSEAAPSGEAVPAASVPCSEERRLVAERCSVATRAREAHQIAQDTFRATQREYDRTVESVERARKVVDGRRILDEKSEAQRRFRAARLSARTAAEIELAASTWLHDVNRINEAVRLGNVQLAHGRERTSQLVVELERMSARLDAARIASATAEQDCYVAREALAACEEARSGSASVAALQAQPPQPAAPATAAEDTAATAAPASPATGAAAPASDTATATPTGPTPQTPEPPPVAPVPAAPPGYADDALPLGRAPYGATSMVLRILRGDREALDRVVTVLAAGSDSEARRWHLDLGALVDAIVAAAIDAAVLDLPQDHAFWGNFSPVQARQVAGVLGGLGSRYDGRGGFADGRVPSARDLALAVGYTGMDPRRVRHWPNEAQMAELYRGVAVAADAFVAEGAPDLTLGQMVGLLGRHAETLTALWDEWGRVRPLLLAAGS